MMYLKIGLSICCGVVLVACGGNETKTVETPEVPKVSESTNYGSGTEAPEAPSYELKSADLTGYSYDISKYTGIDVGEPMDVAVEKIQKYLTPDGENVSVTWETQDKGHGIKIFSGLATNLADDSVKDQEIKAIFKKDDDEFWLIEHGGRIKCWRGENKDQWTTELCP